MTSTCVNRLRASDWFAAALLCARRSATPHARTARGSVNMKSPAEAGLSPYKRASINRHRRLE
jgi:hypothetical protein